MWSLDGSGRHVNSTPTRKLVSYGKSPVGIEMEVRVLTDQDHEVLGTGYCSGYTDVYGKWNTGFSCPSSGNGEPIYCCGIPTKKYCCTKDDEEHSPVIDQAVLLGVALGALLVIVLLTLVSCLFCRRCLTYRRRHPSLSGALTHGTSAGPLYRMHCSSTASGVANMYSFSGQNSAATTPIDTTEPHILVDLDCRHATSLPNSAIAQVPVFAPATPETVLPHIRGNHHIGRHVLCGGHIPNDPPPPYQPDSPASSVMFSEQEPLHSSGISSPSTTSFTQSQPSRLAHHSPETTRSMRSSHTSVNSTHLNIVPTGEDTLYWSTKF